VLALLRSTGDAREAIINAPQLTASWTCQRDELFRVNAALALRACTSVQNALRFVSPDEPAANETATMSAGSFPDLAPLLEAAHALDLAVDSKPIAVHVQFSDATQRDIVSYFGSPQDPNVYPNLATIQSSDARYHVWYNALPESARVGLPVPTSAEQ
jgi:hypothetical protein